MTINKDRAAWAESALKEFMEITGTEQENAVSDLLCDLMHLCEQNPAYENFTEELGRAQRAFATESDQSDDFE